MITQRISSLLFFDAPFKLYIIISPILALIIAALLSLKMSWISISLQELTYLTRMTMVALVKEMLGDKLKDVLAYVPSAVFPAIIFPAIFFNDNGSYVEFSDPKIFASIIAIVVGYFSRNVIATILSGLISYWIILFF